ncbi:hypothetical protein LguiB_001650 [Lonicera macranthoides]
MEVPPPHVAYTMRSDASLASGLTRQRQGGLGSVESRNVVFATQRFATPVDVVVEEVFFLVIDMRYIPRSGRVVTLASGAVAGIHRFFGFQSHSRVGCHLS